MKRIFTALALALAAATSFAATLNPIQLLNPAGSTSGQAIVSAGPTSAPAWGGVSAGAVTYTQGGAGSVARPLASRLQDFINATDFGASTASSAAANTTAINAALAYAATLANGGTVYLPSGTYLVNTIVFPNHTNVSLTGSGSGTVLGASGGDVITWPTQSAGNLLVAYATVQNLTISGGGGTGHLINTQYVASASIRNVWLTNIPAGKDGIIVQGNGAVATHDILISGVYVSTATGKAGIEFTSSSNDVMAYDLFGNGNFGLVNWILVDAGAAQVQIADAHIYNTSGNVISVGAVTESIKFTNVVADNSLIDTVRVTGATGVTFENSKFMVAGSGYSTLVVDNSSYCEFHNTEWEASASGNLHAISSINGSAINLYDGYVRGPNYSSALSGVAVSDTVRTNLLNQVNNQTLNGTTALTDTAANNTGTLAISATSSASGANLRITGQGATTPSKTIRVYNGAFQILNSAYSSALFQMDDSGNLTTAGGLSATAGAFSGALTPSQTAGIVGTTTNNNANAGSVGEYPTPTNLTAVGLTSGAPANVASVSLTAGDYEVSGVVQYNPAGTTTVTALQTGITTTSATMPAAPNITYLNATFATGFTEVISAPVVRISLASTTTVYLVAVAGFGVSTMTANGYLHVRRVR